MTKARIGKRSTLVLPKSVVQELDLHEGDELEVKVIDGRIVMEPLMSVPRSQAWYWTERWQREEQEAEEDVQAGRMTTVKNEEELEAFLNQLGVEHE